MSGGKITRPGYLYYYDGVPAWTIRVPHPSRFEKVKTTIEFKSFLLPQGGLLATIVRLYDVPEQPFYVHRVFDLSEHDVAEYIGASKEALLWLVEIKGGGEDQDVFRLVSLKKCGFLESYRDVIEHNAKLGSRLEGSAALKAFLEIFEPVSEKSGWDAGWNAVAKRYNSD